MNGLLLAGLALGACLLSLISVQVSIRVAHRLDALDRPNMPRKTQTRAIPALGGVALAISFTTVAILGAAMVADGTLLSPSLSVTIPALCAAVIGFLDDRRHLAPWLRLALQGAVALLAFGLGTRVSFTGMMVVDLLLTLLFIVAVTNGVNLLDNSDGLAATTVLVSATGSLVIALLSGQLLVAPMAAVLAGACLGYLWHNWHPARVYMGDAGAYFLGTLLALLVIRLRPEGADAVTAACVALLLVLLPLVDTAFVVVRRMRAGIHPFTAGRDHLSHTLQRRSITVPGSVALLQVVSVSGAVCAVLLIV